MRVVPLVVSFDIDELALPVPGRFGEVAFEPDMPVPELDESELDMPELDDGVVLDEPLVEEPLEDALPVVLEPEGPVVDGPVADEPVPDVAAPPVLDEPPVPDVPVLVVDEPVPLLGLAPEVPLLLDPVCATAMPAPTARDTAAAMARSRGCVLMMSVPVQVQRSDRRPAGLPAPARLPFERAP